MSKEFPKVPELSDLPPDAAEQWLDDEYDDEIPPRDNVPVISLNLKDTTLLETSAHPIEALQKEIKEKDARVVSLQKRNKDRTPTPDELKELDDILATEARLSEKLQIQETRAKLAHFASPESQSTKSRTEEFFLGLSHAERDVIREVIREIPALQSLYAQYRDTKLDPDVESGKTKARYQLMTFVEQTLRNDPLGDPRRDSELIQRDIRRADLLLHRDTVVHVDEQGIANINTAINDTPNLRKLYNEVHQRLLIQKESKLMWRLLKKFKQPTVDNIDVIKALVAELEQREDVQAKAFLQILSYYSQ